MSKIKRLSADLAEDRLTGQRASRVRKVKAQLQRLERRVRNHDGADNNVVWCNGDCFSCGCAGLDERGCANPRG